MSIVDTHMHHALSKALGVVMHNGPQGFQRFAREAARACPDGARESLQQERQRRETRSDGLKNTCSCRRLGLS